MTLPDYRYSSGFGPFVREWSEEHDTCHAPHRTSLTDLNHNLVRSEILNKDKCSKLGYLWNSNSQQEFVRAELAPSGRTYFAVYTLQPTSNGIGAATWAPTRGMVESSTAKTYDDDLGELLGNCHKHLSGLNGMKNDPLDSLELLTMYQLWWKGTDATSVGAQLLGAAEADTFTVEEAWTECEKIGGNRAEN